MDEIYNFAQRLPAKLSEVIKLGWEMPQLVQRDLEAIDIQFITNNRSSMFTKFWLVRQQA
jgi:hypothetical protein